MDIWVNGKRVVTEARTVDELARELFGSPEVLLIEYNGRALTRAEWGEIGLSSGDRVEVLRISAGG